MLIGYVSDEYYSALPDVAVDIEQNGAHVGVARSTASGAIHADLTAGSYDFTLALVGYGAHRVLVEVGVDRVHQFRLLSDKLYGYAWPKWVKSEASAEFRVHSVKPYYLTLWRYGLEKELVRRIGWFDEHAPRACAQTLPQEDFTQTGVQWNRRGYTKQTTENMSAEYSPPPFAAQTVKAPARSGLYYFHAETDSGEFCSFPWVVAPQRPTTPIAVLASTNTWNAYNNFGGRSNYINADKLPPRPTVNARLDLGRFNGSIQSVWQHPADGYSPLSFDRPEPFNHIPLLTMSSDPIRGRQACHLAEAEWRLLAWLEREGHVYDLYADQQLHDGALNLDAYRVLVISTHPEYWSREQFELVRNWVTQRGGNLLYLGGNGVDCEILYPTPSTMQCRTWWPVTPGVSWIDEKSDARWDCRMHLTTGVSPAELLGVVFTEPGAATAAPFEVVNATHWAFAETGLNDRDVFGQASLHERCPGGASGHETDKRSPSSPNGIEVVARGLNGNEGGAEIVYYETASGGSVFSVGSISWPAAVMIDPTCSRITKNALMRALGDA